MGESLVAHSPSAAHQLADEGSEKLDQGFSQFKREIRKRRREQRLDALNNCLDQGSLSVNMTLGACLAVLQTGAILSLADVIERKVGDRAGPDFETELERRLGTWYSARQRAEDLFKFEWDAKYAYLYVGGNGPRYGNGECRVQLERSMRYDYATAFAGDSIGAIFDTRGNQILDDDRALERFATRDKIRELAAVHNRTRLVESDERLTGRAIRELLSGRKTLLELHVHDAIPSANIASITIADEVHGELGPLVASYHEAPPSDRKLEQYEAVKSYLGIYALAAAQDPRIPVL